MNITVDMKNIALNLFLVKQYNLKFAEVYKNFYFVGRFVI